MSTANDLISSALRKVGALASGETADGPDADETLEMMNDILEQWSLEDLMVYYSTVLSIPLISGTESYTVGPTGGLVATRPIELLNASIRDANSIDLPIDIISFEKYQDIIQKETNSSFPRVVAYQQTNPDGTLYVWETPTTGQTLRITVIAQFIQVEDLNTEISLPIGYKKALQDALTVELCIKHGRSEMLEAIMESARVSKMVVKRKNSKKTTMRLSSEFLIGGNGTYNPYSDT